VDLDEVLAATFTLVGPHLTERQRRLLLGAAARALGYGGISRVARLAEASRPMVRRGVAELDQPADPRGRIRQHEGPKRRRDTDPGLLVALDRLVEPDTRGDPQSPLWWTCKSTRELAQALTTPRGIRSATTPSAGCSSSRATGCSARPRPWRVPSIPTETPSSATSTSKLGRIWPLGSRW
jgi:Rhodopirellula transposase DDE domain